MLGFSFPSNYTSCNADYCWAISLLNTDVVGEQTYFIALGSADNSTGTGTLQLSKTELSLAGFSSGVSSSGGTIIYNIFTAVADNFNVVANASCTTGRSPMLNNDTTTNFYSDLGVSTRATGSCTIFAYDPQAPGLVSNSFNFYVGEELSVSLPIGGAMVYTRIPFDLQIATSSNTSLPLAVNVTILCPNGESQLFQITSNVLYPNTIITNATMYGNCKMSAVTDPIAYTTYDLTTVNVYTPVNITSPTEGLFWPVNESLKLLLSSYPEATGRDAYFFFICGTQTVQYNLRVNEVLMREFD